MTPSTKEMVLRALGDMRGDDLYRARRAFSQCSPQEMGEQYGQSGKTRAQMLAEYEAHDTKVAEAIKEVESL